MAIPDPDPQESLYEAFLYSVLNNGVTPVANNNLDFWYPYACKAYKEGLLSLETIAVLGFKKPKYVHQKTWDNALKGLSSYWNNDPLGYPPGAATAVSKGGYISTVTQEEINALYNKHLLTASYVYLAGFENPGTDEANWEYCSSPLPMAEYKLNALDAVAQMEQGQPGVLEGGTLLAFLLGFISLTGYAAYGNGIFSKPFNVSQGDWNQVKKTLPNVVPSGIALSNPWPGSGQAHKKLNKIILNKKALKKVQNKKAKTKPEKVSPDPMIGWQTVKQESEKTSNIEEITTIPSGHQTLVVIETSAKCNDKYRERLQRLIGGFNTHESIKADVITVTDGKIYNGLVFVGVTPGGLENPLPKTDHVQVVTVKGN